VSPESGCQGTVGTSPDALCRGFLLVNLLKEMEDEQLTPLSQTQLRRALAGERLQTAAGGLAPGLLHNRH